MPQQAGPLCIRHLVLCRRGELYPCETDIRLCEELATGQEVEVDMDNDVLTVVETGKQYNLKPLGEVRALRCTFLPFDVTDDIERWT